MEGQQAQLMTPMQRQRLNEYMASLDFRQRIAKAVLKALFVLLVTCIVFAFWASLVSCGIYKQHIAPHDLDFSQSEMEQLR